MQAERGTLATAAPAWPTLAGLQLVVGAVLVGLWWRIDTGPTVETSPVEVQVLALDPVAAAEAVDAARVRERPRARALLAEDVTRTKGFLALTASAAGLDLLGTEWRTAPLASWPGVEEVAVEVQLEGHAFDLPVFLDGLHRQQATVRVQSVVAAVGPGGRTRAVVDLRYHRPAAADAQALQDRVARTVPAAEAELRQTLARAAEVADLRRFAEHAQARALASEQARARLARELPAALVGLHPYGGTVAWSSGGVQVQAAQR